MKAYIFTTRRHQGLFALFTRRRHARVRFFELAFQPQYLCVIKKKIHLATFLRSLGTTVFSLSEIKYYSWEWMTVFSSDYPSTTVEEMCLSSLKSQKDGKDNQSEPKDKV